MNRSSARVASGNASANSAGTSSLCRDTIGIPDAMIAERRTEKSSEESAMIEIHEIPEADKIIVTCPRCGAKRIVGKKSSKEKKFTGLCQSCTRILQAEVQRKDRVPIKCPVCGNIRELCVIRVKAGQYRETCDVCRKQAPHRKKLKTATLNGCTVREERVSRCAKYMTCKHAEDCLDWMSRNDWVGWTVVLQS